MKTKQAVPKSVRRENDKTDESLKEEESD